MGFSSWFYSRLRSVKGLGRLLPRLGVLLKGLGRLLGYLTFSLMALISNICYRFSGANLEGHCLIFWFAWM